MANLENMTISVSPSVLKSRAQAVLTRISSIEKRFQTIEETVNRSTYYWTGNGGDTHRRVFRESKEGIETVLASFQETAQLLESIAGEYETTEAKQTSKAGALKTDVII